jgi:23S rRNA G2069 N7-methylase RlmK/C1962 C5-methylase RlmI
MLGVLNQLITLLLFNKATRMQASRMVSISSLKRSFHRLHSVTLPTSNGSEIAKPIVVLLKGKARLFQDGNPLVYGGAIKQILFGKAVVPAESLQPGTEVHVADHMLNPIGKGIYNPFSTYRVRMMARSFEPEFNFDLDQLLKHRIQQAINLRRAIALPQEGYNTAYRLINGEGDRISGLIVDVFDDTVVIQSSALWVEHHRFIVQSSLESILHNNESINFKKYKFIWRQAPSRLNQDGYASYAQLVGQPLIDSMLNNVHVLENGVKYLLTDDGQKTGMFHLFQQIEKEFMFNRFLL